MPSHLDCVQHFFCLVNAVVSQAYFFKRAIARKALKQQDSPFVAKSVAWQIHILDLTWLVNDDLKQAVWALLIDAAVSQTKRFKRLVWAQALREIFDSLVSNQVVIKLQYHYRNFKLR